MNIVWGNELRSLFVSLCDWSKIVCSLNRINVLGGASKSISSFIYMKKAVSLSVLIHAPYLTPSVVSILQDKVIFLGIFRNSNISSHSFLLCISSLFTLWDAGMNVNLLVGTLYTKQEISDKRSELRQICTALKLVGWTSMFIWQLLFYSDFNSFSSLTWKDDFKTFLRWR